MLAVATNSYSSGAELGLRGRIGKGSSMVSGLNSSTELLGGMGKDERAVGLQLEIQDNTS